MSNKHLILEMLKDNVLTVKKIAENSQFNENEVRTYVHRLLKDNLIESIGHEKRYKTYTAIKKENVKFNEKMIKYLRFLNDFFKDNAEHLIENKKILKFIEKNEYIFNEIELVVENA